MDHVKDISIAFGWWLLITGSYHIAKYMIRQERGRVVDAHHWAYKLGAILWCGFSALAIGAAFDDTTAGIGVTLFVVLVVPGLLGIWAGYKATPIPDPERELEKALQAMDAEVNDET